MIFRLFPAILSLLVLGAHFLRLGNLLVVALLIACIVLLWVRRPWVAVVVQTVLALGVIVWILTATGIAMDRIQNEEPWLRMAAIIGAVLLFTVYSAWHFRHPRLRAWYGTGADTDPDGDIAETGESDGRIG